jgi:hypothetical protein
MENLATGGCGACFQPIYNNFTYSFVAQSGQQVVLLWKLYATPTNNGAPSESDYFYSKIEVLDATGNLVYSGPINQKSFLGSFSIFSAIALGPDLLATGAQYQASLYYLIPNVNLQMQVTGAAITAIKARE